MAHCSPGPHVVTLSSPARSSIRIEAGPSGVRVTRHTAPGPIRIVGSPWPRRSGAIVSPRSRG